MEKFNWGNVNDPDVYLDDYNKRALRMIQARPVFTRLADALIEDGRIPERLKEYLTACLSCSPMKRCP
jgi:hypothetical protein